MSERNDPEAVQELLSWHQGNGDAEVEMHRRPLAGTDPARVAALERENIRLQLLVAELLIKNQQLRKAEQPD